MRPVVLILSILYFVPLPAQAADVARVAVERALPLLQRSASKFVTERACFSCHHNALSIITTRLAERRGFAIDKAALTTVETRTFGVLVSNNAVDAAIQGSTLSDPTPNDSLLLMAAHDAGITGDLATGVLARRLTHWQRSDGRWMTSDFRPPHSSSEFTATASAVAAIRAYLPDELSAERDAAVRRAASWLAGTWPRSTEDATFRVMGLVWSNAPQEVIDSAVHVLVSMQTPGGGWPQLPGYAPDAYSTGESLYALRLSGMPGSAAEWQRGVRFLIQSQAADGSWHVRSRMLSPAEVSPPYFHTGFPYRHDEFLSYAGSCWAVMALLSAMPEQIPNPKTQIPNPKDELPSLAVRGPTWLRAALFGTAGELTAALDAGLDPNSKTPGGTTLLMASALDSDKTRLLLARGADPKLRSQSRVDALTIAASHLGTTDAIAALLDGGATVEPPEDVRVQRTPIVAAALAGDVQNVTLLLQHGAKPSAQALSEAITFGHTDVVRALIEAGGDVTGVDSTGINLVHWATITNRPSMIPLLTKAGVPVNAVDDFGFTPLMYAATIDHGDTALIEALLAAGAKTDIRNDDGRTALQQAQHFRRPDAVRVLRGR